MQAVDGDDHPALPALPALPTEAEAALLDLIHDAILVRDPATDTLTYWNRGAEELYGWAPDAALGRPAHALLRTVFPAPRAVIEEILGREGRWEGELVQMGRAGTPVVVASRWALRRDARGVPDAILEIGTDVTARKRAEEELARRALHDALTGLPNRALLLDRLGQALRAAARAGGGTAVALLLLDLDRFKEVNDTLGHPAGDALLAEVAARLRAAVRGSDTVGRLGGDEFAVLLPGDDAAGAARVAATVAAALAAPLVVEGQALVVGGSIGIAACPAHGADVATLLRHADIAMYTAKRTRTGVAVYDPAQDARARARLALLDDLRAGIAAGAFTLHYQPKIDLDTGRSSWVEALVRWAHPTRGLLPPEVFIPLAESTGLIVPLTRWVLEEATRQAGAWRRAGLAVSVAVNLSAASLQDPALPATVAALLGAHALPAGLLRVELTESMLMADVGRAPVALAALADIGVRVSVDDFGTGYSSLAYLKRLPVDELKIDKAFVRDVAVDASDAAIVGATIGLGHGLGLRVVGEGVESQASLDALRALGCDGAQGYHIARPLPPAAMTRWLRDAAGVTGAGG